MTKFNQAKFESKAKELVAEHLNYEADEKDVIDEKDVSIVWFSNVGANATAMLKSDLDHNCRHFNVTYWGEFGVYVVGVYRLVGWTEFHEHEEELQ